LQIFTASVLLNIAEISPTFDRVIKKVTSSSVIAERPNCRVGHFWPKLACRQYRSVFNHCDV